MNDESVEAGLAIKRLSGMSSEVEAMLKQTYQEFGWEAYLKMEIEEIKKERAKQGFIPAYVMVLYSLSLGDKEAAFDWLEQAYEQRDPFIRDLKVFPALNPLRSDPRFQDLLSRVGLPK